MPDAIGAGLTTREPDVYAALEIWKRHLLVNLNCVKVGKIVSYNASARTAQVSISFKRVKTDGSTAEYPIINDVPVFTLQGGATSVQLPISPGDHCILIFSDRCLDSWLQNGSAAPPPIGRLHDISDAIALVGINPLSPSLAAPPSGEGGVYGSSGAKVAVNNGMVTVQNSAQNLATILNTLLSALSTASSFAAINSAASTAQTALQSLLY